MTSLEKMKLVAQRMTEEESSMNHVTQDTSWLAAAAVINDGEQMLLLAASHTAWEITHAASTAAAVTSNGVRTTRTAGDLPP